MNLSSKFSAKLTWNQKGIETKEKKEFIQKNSNNHLIYFGDKF